MTNESDLASRASKLESFRRLSDGCPRSHDDQGSLIEIVGLPRAIGDWFKPCDITEVVGLAGSEICKFGESEFGYFGINIDGEVQHYDEDGSCQFVSSSLYSFLLFAIEVSEAAGEEYADFDARMNRMRQADPKALKNAEGVWSLLFEEIQAGLY